MYNAVGIDVSKGKNAIAVLQPGGIIARKHFDIFHTFRQVKDLTCYLQSLDGDTKVVMECTGRYHETMVTTGANKFLRIYYGKVKECLQNIE